MAQAHSDNSHSSMPQDAIVLAAGLGTRMRPITDTIPKPLVEVAGRSLLDRNLDCLRTFGARSIVVNAHHLMEKMQAHLDSLCDENIFISKEPELLDQAGGIKAALPQLGGQAFFALNGDAFFCDHSEEDSNLARLAKHWNPEKMDFLMLLAPTHKANGFSGAGDFFLEKQDECSKLSFRGEADTAPFVNTGVGIYNASAFADLPQDKYPLVPLFKKAAKENRFYGLPMAGHWFHVGTPEAISQTQEKLSELGLK